MIIIIIIIIGRYISNQQKNLTIIYKNINTENKNTSLYNDKNKSPKIFNTHSKKEE